ncbi:SGNH/GDSL hydrolase family protein [Anaeromyxobacter paludicola]|uniref:SGNH hydrolase n=1 Tax=Anaeromyxobacter paludicola TaxID=2918171 RepID=A0ABM7XD20_9BACT|nr:SGNH/GDSL hydrolase family protein [Anaeromyxobacter paludicola]BDG09762.1 SGNH hydrolase [Anaeromyxobacter paludicola]
MSLALLALLASAALPAEHPVIYAALGDSTGVGVGAGNDGGYVRRTAERLRDAGHPVQLANLCVSGARAADVLQGQLPLLAPTEPDLVTLGVGINDVTNATPLPAFEKAFGELLDRLAATGARVVVLDVPDLSLSPLARGDVARASIRGRVEAVNAVILAAAARHRFPVADLYTESQAELPGHPELLCEDRFHPSKAGYDRWAAALWPVVARAAGIAAEGLPTRPARQ